MATTDEIVFWIPTAIQLILTSATRGTPVAFDAGRAAANENCPCTRNPYLAFYRAGQRAFEEALGAVQHDVQIHDERDRLALRTAIHALACRDIDGFCRVCIVGEPCEKRPTGKGSGRYLLISTQVNAH